MPNLPRPGKALSIGTFDGLLADGGTTCDLRQLRFIDAYGLVQDLLERSSENRGVRDRMTFAVRS